VKPPPEQPPPGAATSTTSYRVPFFDTDAMGVVHHANYLHYLELARVRYLEEHDQPYRLYVESGRHFAVTRCDVRYRGAARFDDELAVRCWLTEVGGATVTIAYRIERDDELLVSATTEHALIDGDGHPRRIPRERRASLASLIRPTDRQAD
jgi:acyl-CoA thioester hydrolase